MNVLINTSKAGVSINNQMKKLVDQNNKEYEKLEKKLVNEENELLKKKMLLILNNLMKKLKVFKQKFKSLEINEKKI